MSDIALSLLSLERVDQLSCVQTNKRFIALPLEEVRALDRQLADGWKVDFFNEDLATRLAQVPDTLAVQRYVEAHNTSFDKPGWHKFPLKAEVKIYSAIAHPKMLGPITSMRRHFILDAVAEVVGIIRYLKMCGDVLDIGCHGGITTSLLAGALKRPVVGIDPCEEAITLGQRHPARDERAELIRTHIPWDTGRRFDIALSLDAMPQIFAATGPYLRNIGQLLNPGGIAVIASSYWTMVNAMVAQQQLHSARLAFGFADVLGGLGGLPPEFGGRPCIVLVKGSDRALPRNFLSLASNWSKFASYANQPSVPPREKTQSFHRAKEFRSE